MLDLTVAANSATLNLGIIGSLYAKKALHRKMQGLFDGLLNLCGWNKRPLMRLCTLTA